MILDFFFFRFFFYILFSCTFFLLIRFTTHVQFDLFHLFVISFPFVSLIYVLCCDAFRFILVLFLCLLHCSSLYYVLVLYFLRNSYIPLSLYIFSLSYCGSVFTFLSFFFHSLSFLAWFRHAACTDTPLSHACYCHVCICVRARGRLWVSVSVRVCGSVRLYEPTCCRACVACVCTYVSQGMILVTFFYLDT